MYIKHRSNATHGVVAESEAVVTGCPDLTVEEIVADPIVRALMKADRIDPAAFEALLHSIGSKAPAPRERVGVSPDAPGRTGPAPSAFAAG